MALPVINIGDDFGNTITLKRGDVAIAIANAATVSVAIVDKDKAYRMSDVVVINKDDAGNDWPNGVVRVDIPKASQVSGAAESDVIKNIAATKSAFVEVSVLDTAQSGGNEDNSWHFSVSIAGAVISS